MTQREGFFSIIQYCPDLDRGEYANVGVVIAVPELGFFDVRMSDDNEGPKQRFGRDTYDDARLTQAKHALENRIRAEGGGWVSADDLKTFGKREGNHLLLAAPRTILVEDAKADLDELFDRLVHVDARHKRRQPRPDLKPWFDRPDLFALHIQRDVEIEIPQLGKMVAPYAYQNGCLNLIKPEGFSTRKQRRRRPMILRSRVT